MNTTLARDQLQEFAHRIADIDGKWETPTALPDWDVAGLTRHVTAVAWMQAEAFHRARLGITEAPSWVELHTDTTALPGALEEARRSLDAALKMLDLRPDPIVPLPFATMPASIAVPVLVLEYGVHLYDLRAALDEKPELDADAADVVLNLLPLWMPLAGTPTDAGTSVAVGTAAFRYDDGWKPTDDAACTISGDPSALALFALGRIGADDPGIDIDGDATIARRFKELFPGP